MAAEFLQRYPRVCALTGDPEDSGAAGQITLEVMNAAHADQVLALARALPPHDLLFLRRDISEPRVMAAWVASIERGTIYSLVAVTADDAVIGCSAVVLDPHSFSRHVAELRVVLAPAKRALGLGRLLIQESFLTALALDLRKLTVQMTADQEAAVTLFMDLGFRQEGLLRDEVMDGDGTTHDLIVLGHDVERVRARRELYGISEAFPAGGEG